MKKVLMILLTGLFCLPIFASQLKKISLAELDKKTEFILLGYVDEIVKSDKVSDTIKIRIISVLKGMFHHSGYLQIRLHNKGGLREFDPVLEKGEIAIFMLGADSKLAYPGSIATFPKFGNFKINTIELSEEERKKIEELKKIGK